MNGEIALPQGYALHEYRIESTLGIGGFGLTYLATDCNLNVKVAIKEYLPGDLAVRRDDQSIRSKSDTTLDTFNWGRSRFLEESRTLASFRHPNIVRVLRFFEANQTAYMVMEFVAGLPLNDWIRTRRPLGEHALTAMTLALLDGVEVIHRAGYLHRDIKPGNIFIRDDASPVLLDFGSARVAAADTERTAIISPGYAPLEQYHAHGNQGPWSDLYALGAVLYWIVTGDKPMEATARVPEDSMRPVTHRGEGSHYSRHFLEAIDWALVPAEKSRPQSVAGWRKALSPAASLPASEPNSIFAGRTVMPDLTGRPASLPASMVFEGETLKKLATDLAAHMGPVASIVVKAAAKKAMTVSQLVEALANEIADPKARAAFVKKHALAVGSVPVGDASRSRSAPTLSVTTGAPSSAQRFDAGLLARAETELAQYIGAVARAIVRRAATKAHSDSELYTLLANEIEDPVGRKAFLRKAMSISGRQ